MGLKGRVYWIQRHYGTIPGLWDKVPIVENLHIKTLEAIENGQRLNMGDWHGESDDEMEEPKNCDTTHCRAGFAVHLAGQAGYDLDTAIGTENAATLIIAKSCPWMVDMPNFYTDDDTALRQIEECASIEKGGV